MTKPNALHHLAISTADMKGQIAFFTDVLGTELVALYWMHGVEGAWHAFLKLNEKCSIALVHMPEMKSIDAIPGVTHSGNPRAPSAPGTMQHVALNVDDEAALLAMRDRIRSRGVIAIGPVDHGVCKSIYFAGLENLSLEIATSSDAIDAHAWIDPEVVALAGINAAELRSFTVPALDKSDGGAVPQPPYDPAKPHQRFPDAEYRQLIALPDSVVAQMLSETEPPVGRTS
ncbi:MAG: VOC family protein [Alphaproteobacteria bacterium]|nr:VOC family protein [Alphaproteobacteria bacterium]